MQRQVLGTRYRVQLLSARMPCRSRVLLGSSTGPSGPNSCEHGGPGDCNETEVGVPGDVG